MRISNRKKSIKMDKNVSNMAARRMRVDLKKKKKKKEKDDRSQPIVLSFLGRGISRKNFSPKFALGRVKLCVSNRINSIKRGKTVSNPAARRMRVD